MMAKSTDDNIFKDVFKFVIMLRDHVPWVPKWEAEGMALIKAKMLSSGEVDRGKLRDTFNAAWNAERLAFPLVR